MTAMRANIGTMVVAFPGSFDPPSLGHLDIVRRAAGMFGELLVIVAENSRKNCLFSVAERADMLARLTEDLGNVRVGTCGGLLVDFLKAEGIRLLVRGVRGPGDFSYEFDLAMAYGTLAPGIETLFMPCDPRYFVLHSSLVKEIAAFGGDVGGMVPPLVAAALREKYGRGKGPAAGP